MTLHIRHTSASLTIQENADPDVLKDLISALKKLAPEGAGWWHQAEGRYERGQTPREGSVLAMPGSGKMRLGHVAMVSKVVGDREILLTHANWSRRGGIERDVRAIDVSDKGDWSRVRIWYAGNGDLGTSSSPAYGFIYPGTMGTERAEVRTTLLLPTDVIELAAQGS